MAIDDERHAVARKRLSALQELLGQKGWMMETTDHQEALLKKLLEKGRPPAVAVSFAQAAP